MISLSDLGDVFSLFGLGLGVGVGLLSIFFILGNTIAFIYSLMARA